MSCTASFGKLDEMYHMAYEQGIETGEGSYTPTLFVALGEEIYFSLDDGLNKVHIQRQADIEIAEAILEYRKNHEQSLFRRPEA